MNSYETWVSSFVKNLCEYFNLAGWNIKVEFVDENGKDSQYADNEINSAYMFSTMTFYKPSRVDFENGELDRLTMAVVHEIVHIFLDPFHDSVCPFLSQVSSPEFSKMLETQTQKLTMVFLKSLPKNIIPKRSLSGKHNRTSKNNPKNPTVH
jgi:hypothetical protein